MYLYFNGRCYLKDWEIPTRLKGICQSKKMVQKICGFFCSFLYSHLKKKISEKKLHEKVHEKVDTAQIKHHDEYK